MGTPWLSQTAENWLKMTARQCHSFLTRMALPLALFARRARTGGPAREVRLVCWGVSGDLRRPRPNWPWR